MGPSSRERERKTDGRGPLAIDERGVEGSAGCREDGRWAKKAGWARLGKGLIFFLRME